MHWIILFIIFLSGCQQRGWKYSEVNSDCIQFNSAFLCHQAADTFSGIEVHLLRAEFGILGFLNVYTRHVVSEAVTFEITEQYYTFSAKIMQGGQRLLLPPEATELLIESLLSGQIVNVYLDGYFTQLLPNHFLQHYCRFLQKFV